MEEAAEVGAQAVAEWLLSSHLGCSPGSSAENLPPALSVLCGDGGEEKDGEEGEEGGALTIRWAVRGEMEREALHRCLDVRVHTPQMAQSSMHPGPSSPPPPHRSSSVVCVLCQPARPSCGRDSHVQLSDRHGRSCIDQSNSSVYFVQRGYLDHCTECDIRPNADGLPLCLPRWAKARIGTCCVLVDSDRSVCSTSDTTFLPLASASNASSFRRSAP